MPQYIKSHSNYVLKSKHQTLGDGSTIFERDITTIGGLNQFAPGQTPIYRSNNFIITVRDDGGISNQYNRKKWTQNTKSGDTWTMTSLEGMVSEGDDQDDTKIVLKQDYYDFRDFCYYGSLAEMFRASITDIIARFPGELYGTTNNVYYTITETVDGSLIEHRYQLGKNVPSRDSNGRITGYTESSGNFYYVVNPFGIDIHSKSAPKDANPIKYFANDGYKNYNYINGNTKTQATWSSNYQDENCYTKGDKLATITINGITIGAYLGDDNIVYYLSESSGFHIRPKDDLIDEFYDECDNFQKLILNPKTNYKATFSVIEETDEGFSRRFEDFVFPTSEGDYNIDASSYGFNTYTTRLSQIGEFYDELFTDNLYRSMTHEAIKNFDWTYTREYVQGDEEEYVLGGQKIQKALRVFAREFDEILSYINNIKNLNRVTYDERGNLPDYFLTDTVENEGWNVELVIPYFTESRITNIGSCDDVEIKLTQPSGTVQPYKITDEKGYFLTCCGGGIQPCEYSGSQYTFIEARANEFTKFDSCNGALRNRIKRYTDDMKYTYHDVNNEFLRRLKLNSRAIWRHKGTLDGIDMILSLFGMRSKKFCDEMNKSMTKDHKCKKYNMQTCQNCDKYEYDYDITEYRAKVNNPICDNWDAVHQMYHIDWINSTKTITYDYRSLSNYDRDSSDVSYIPYQGLPVSYEQKDGYRNLYPNFNKYEQYDGNPYFQMKGGWLDKEIKGRHFQFNADDYIVFHNDNLFKETVRNIRRFDSLQEMLSVPSYEIHDNQIVYVSKIESNICVLDGVVYEIKKDIFCREGKEGYIELVKQNDVVKAGDDLYFTEYVMVYNRDKLPQTYYLNTMPNGQTIKAYITKNGEFMCAEDDKNYDEFNIITTTTADTNYYIIEDFSQSNRINNNGGWRRLKIGDREYNMLSTIINDNKGNNPHNGTMQYDNGVEYFKYFEQLFKYSIENDLFDERCYDNYEYSKFNDISTHGFSFDESGMDKYYFNDENVIPSADTTYKTYEVNGETRKWGNKNDNKGITVDYKNSKIWSYVNENKDTITNDKLNTKVIKITFRLHYDVNDSRGVSELKYIDDIVLNYLTQMIPSTAILQIKYETTR